MIFFIGWHQPVNGRSGCALFDYCMISVNRLIGRKSFFPVKNWIMDSGAFSRILSGKGHLPVEKYAFEVMRWKNNGSLLAVVAQDYMCDPFTLTVTGKTILEHQRMTIDRYDALISALPEDAPYVMPVLQGFNPVNYVDHVRMYGHRLKDQMWVGVGSVCKRNNSPSEIENILLAIKRERPDLNLHGFGIKKTSLSSGLIHDLLYSADSQASSFAQRIAGGNSNCPLFALKYDQEIQNQPLQMNLFSFEFK